MREYLLKDYLDKIYLSDWILNSHGNLYGQAKCPILFDPNRSKYKYRLNTFIGHSMRQNYIKFLVFSVSTVVCNISNNESKAINETDSIDDSSMFSRYLSKDIIDKFDLLFYSDSSSRQYPSQFSYAGSLIGSKVLSKDDVLSMQKPITKPVISSKCETEVGNRYSGYPLTDNDINGYDMNVDQTNYPNIPTLNLGSVNLTMVEHLELGELVDCVEITFPQLIYLLESANIAKIHDACLSSLKPGLFSLLTPHLVEILFKHKPCYITYYWRFFDPLVLAQCPSVMEKILGDSNRSFLCCNLLANDFNHVNNLRSASDECIASIFLGEKCKNIDYSFFKEGSFDEYKPRFNGSNINHLLPSLKSVHDIKLPNLPNVSKEVYESLKSRVLELMDVSCFENLPPETRVPIWLNYKETYLNKNIVNMNQCNNIQKLLDDDLALFNMIQKDLTSPTKHTNKLSSSSASSPIMIGSIMAIVFSTISAFVSVI